MVNGYNRVGYVYICTFIASGLNRLAVFLLVIYTHALVLTLVQVAGIRHNPRANLPKRNWPYTFWVSWYQRHVAGYPIGTGLLSSGFMGSLAEWFAH